MSNFMLRLVATAFGLAVCGHASALVVGPEIAIPGPGLNNPRAAFDGTSYLVVWSTGSGVYGARVAPGGALNDPAPFAIYEGDVGPNVSVAFGSGGNYFVFWEDTRLQSTFSPGNYTAIYGARVSPTGVVLDSTGFLVAVGRYIDEPPDPNASLAPKWVSSAACNSDICFVVWVDERTYSIQGGAGVFGARVDPTGTVLDPDGLLLWLGSFNHPIGYSPSVTSDGNSFIVAWEDFTPHSGYGRIGMVGVSGAGVVQEGTLLGGFGGTYPETYYQYYPVAPALGFDGANYLMAWAIAPQSTGYPPPPTFAGIQASRLPAQAGYFDLTGNPIVADHSGPELVFDGKDYLVAWVNVSQVKSARVSPLGLLLDTSVAPLFPEPVVDPWRPHGVVGIALSSDQLGLSLLAYNRADSLSGNRGLYARLLTTWASLMVSRTGGGAGSVTSSPSGIDCGPSCMAQFDTPTTVTLTAAPDPGSSFAGWLGACTGMALTCTVTIDTAKSVTAKFTALPPKVTSVSPNCGQSNGGMALTILGANFRPGATVKLGGIAAIDVVVRDATTITARTGPHAAGVVRVTVTNPDGQAGSLAGGFTYYWSFQPGISSVSPTSGPTAGGTTVTIVSGFYAPGAIVKIGGIKASVVSLTDNLITVVTPRHSAGLVNVSVTNPDGQTATLENGFKYVAPPVINRLTPSTGSIQGGTTVAVSGSGFQSGVAVTFDGTAAKVLSKTATSLKVTTPPHSGGPVNVVVSNPDGQTASLAAGYNYIAP